jgi:hypothetical protein
MSVLGPRHASEAFDDLSQNPLLPMPPAHYVGLPYGPDPRPAGFVDPDENISFPYHQPRRRYRRVRFARLRYTRKRPAFKKRLFQKPSYKKSYTSARGFTIRPTGWLTPARLDAMAKKYKW